MPGLSSPRINPALDAEQRISNSEDTGNTSLKIRGVAYQSSCHLEYFFQYPPCIIVRKKVFTLSSLYCSAKDADSALKSGKNALSVLEQKNDSFELESVLRCEHE